MPRAMIGFMLLVIGGITAVGLGQAGAAQQGLPTAYPLVGAWQIAYGSGAPANVPALLVVSSDGTVTGSTLAGSDAVGVWHETGSSTAALTLVTAAPGEGGAFGETLRIRGTVTVAADGNGFTAVLTTEVVQQDGVGTGQTGPITAHGQRIVVEPMGTPVAPAMA